MAESDAQAATTTTPGDEDFLVEARELYKTDEEAVRTNFRNMADDIRFFAEDQWLNEDRVAREAQNRPVVTEDHLAPAVRQITNDMRMNKPSVKARPVDSAADVEIARIYEGLIRNIEQQSFAASGNAYVKAGENATVCGQGAFRIITEYSTDDSFDQDIRIVPIRNPLSVIWDSDAESPTRDDARRCWVLTWMSHEAFKATYPGRADTNFEQNYSNETWFSDWNRRDEVLIAEYFYKRPKTKTMWRMALDQRIVDVTDMDDEQKVQLVEAQARDFVEAGEPLPADPYEERTIDTSEVWRAVINGADVLEAPRKWPGKYIPVIHVTGEEIFLNENRVMRGLVRVGKDSQRMINYHNSAAIEHVSLAPKQPYLVTTAQISGLENEWQIANRQNAPYLRYKTDSKAPGPPVRAPAPQIPAALLTLKQEAVSGLHATTNVYPSSTGAQSNEISGVAIQRRDTQGDVANFHFVDNLNHSISYCGKQLLDLIPKIYDGQRIVRILGEDDAEEMIEINMVDPTTGKINNDLSAGKYDIEMVPGPSFSTKRAEAADFFGKFVQSASPEDTALVMDLLVKHLDLPGADELYERFRKRGVATGLIEPDPDKGDEPPGEPEPSAELLLAQAEMKKADADLINANTKAAQNQTSAMKNAADARKSFAESEGQQLENVATLVEMLVQTGELERVVAGMVNQLTEQTLASLLGNMVQPQGFGVNTPENPNGGV